MEGHIDIKAICWFRIPIEKKELIPEIIDRLKSGENPIDVYNDYQTDDTNESEVGFMDTINGEERYIYPEENGGQATIQVYQKQKLIWENVPGYNNLYEQQSNDSSE